MIKATTQHGTYYLIDDENGRAMRVKAEDRNDMYGDGDWFYFSRYYPMSRKDPFKSAGEIGMVQVGWSIYFDLIGQPFRDYDWRLSTDVVSVEEV